MIGRMMQNTKNSLREVSPMPKGWFGKREYKQRKHKYEPYTKWGNLIVSEYEPHGQRGYCQILCAICNKFSVIRTTYLANYPNDCGCVGIVSIYFLLKTNGTVRIGRSKNLESRIATHRSSADDFEVINVLHGPPKLEQAVFGHFYKQHIRHSFYQYTPEMRTVTIDQFSYIHGVGNPEELGL